MCVIIFGSLHSATHFLSSSSFQLNSFDPFCVGAPALFRYLSLSVRFLSLSHIHTHTHTHSAHYQFLSLSLALTHTRILTHLSASPWLDFSFSVITGFLSTSYVTCCSHWPPPCFLLYHFSVTDLPLLLPPGANKAETHNML